MTAGERIGGNPQGNRQIDEQGQTSLFAAGDSEPAASPEKRKSIFSALGGKIRSQMASLRDTDDGDSQQPEDLDNDDYEVEQELDVLSPEPSLPEGIPTEQLDIESSLADETEQTEYADEPVEIQRAEPAATELRAQASGSQRSEVKQQESSGQTSEVLVLNVMAQEGREFRGEDLMHTVITSGLKFGDMQIFHHRFGNGSTGPVIFSLANILNPGTFDLNNMSQFSTIG